MDVIKYLMSEWKMCMLNFNLYFIIMLLIYFITMSCLKMLVKFIYFQVHALGMGNWEWCEGGEGPYELPPSRGWPCLVENIKLFSK